MSRPIKFRLWTGSEMIDWNQLKWRDYSLISISTYGNDLMQFTGLLDMSGNEVYEGDIVRWSEWEGIEVGDVSGVYEVKWNTDKCALGLYDPFENDWYGFDETSFDEVIGNIYQNPELLTKNQ